MHRGTLLYNLTSSDNALAYLALGGSLIDLSPARGVGALRERLRIEEM